MKEHNDHLKQENARLLETHKREEAETKERLQQERTARLERENKRKDAENKCLNNDRAADSSLNHTVKVWRSPQCCIVICPMFPSSFTVHPNYRLNSPHVVLIFLTELVLTVLVFLC